MIWKKICVIICDKPIINTKKIKYHIWFNKLFENMYKLSYVINQWEIHRKSSITYDKTRRKKNTFPGSFWVICHMQSLCFEPANSASMAFLIAPSWSVTTIFGALPNAFMNAFSNQIYEAVVSFFNKPAATVTHLRWFSMAVNGTNTILYLTRNQK